LSKKTPCIATSVLAVILSVLFIVLRGCCTASSCLLL